MFKNLPFGENVAGYDIPVLNEREIRAAAGILFLIMFIGVLQAGNGDFTLIKYGVIGFLLDFLIRVFVSPRYAPTLILGRWIVRNQTPEYVGARQKKFAWQIGIALALTMLILMVLINSFSPITGIICFICLIFLFFESVFGICLGCKMYPWFFGKENLQYCPGEVCEIKARHNIQKMGRTHAFIFLGFVVFFVLVYFLFHDFLSVQPFDLFGITS